MNNGHFQIQDRCFVPGFLTNLEYASISSTIQASFTLILMIAVVITKKIKFSKVFGVEQNLNKTRFFNSAHIYGPNICAFLCSVMMFTMTCKRFLPKMNQDIKEVS